MENGDCPSRSAAEAADELAYERIRCFAAVERLLGDQLGAPGWTPEDVLAELMRRVRKRVHDFVVVFGADDIDECTLLLAEAIDNLGNGVELRPNTVAGFRR